MGETGERTAEKPQTMEDAKRQDAIDELYRRGRVRKYFFGPGDFRSGEGFGFIVGGLLCLVLGAWLFPMLFGGGTVRGHEKYLFWIMTGIGVYLTLKGVYVMYKEKNKVRTPVSDAQFDEIFDRDLKIAEKAGEEALKQAYVLPPNAEFLHIYGLSYHSTEKNLPLCWRAGEDRKIRYSNIFLLTLAFSEEEMYAHNSIYNCRSGQQRFPHLHRYDKEQITGVTVEDREVERVTTEQKVETKRVSAMLVGIRDREEINELTVVLRDYDIIDRNQGYFDDSESLAKIEELRNKLKKQIQEGSEG